MSDSRESSGLGMGWTPTTTFSGTAARHRRQRPGLLAGSQAAATPGTECIRPFDLSEEDLALRRSRRRLPPGKEFPDLSPHIDWSRRGTFQRLQLVEPRMPREFHSARRKPELR